MFSPPRRRYLIGFACAVAVGLGAPTAARAVLAEGPGSPAQPSQLVLQTAAADAHGIDPDLVAAMTIDGMAPRACGGLAPLEVLAARPGAENADTAQARALRAVIAHDPTAGQSPQRPTGWVLLRENSAGQVTFGQRTGQVGIGATVDLQRHASEYAWAGSGGCGPVAYPDGRAAVRADSYTSHSQKMQVHYSGGGCSSSPVSLTVRETPDFVDVLLVQPAAQGNTWCAGEATMETATASLQQPLGTRKVRDLSNLPPQHLAVR